MTITKLIIIIIGLPFIGACAYFLLWIIILMNLVEEPLPESEEMVPDIGIIENTELGDE